MRVLIVSTSFSYCENKIWYLWEVFKPCLAQDKHTVIVIIICCRSRRQADLQKIFGQPQAGRNSSSVWNWFFLFFSSSPFYFNTSQHSWALPFSCFWRKCKATRLHPPLGVQICKMKTEALLAKSCPLLTYLSVSLQNSGPVVTLLPTTCPFSQIHAGEEP